MMELWCSALKASALLLSVVLWVPACAGAGVDSWTNVPSTVKKFQRALSTSFTDRTSLLLGTTNRVVGGTGSTNAPLVYISCTGPKCIPPDSQGEYVAVVEERDLPALLGLIHTSTGSEGSSASNIPQSVITLPAPTSLPFAPATINPLSMYYPPSELQFMPAWNPSGLNLTDLALPCGVFLAPEDLADEYREHAQHNNRRGFKGPTYGASVALSTQMTLQSDSTACIQGQHCLPLGGYSVWAAMPPFMPQQGTAAPEREQIVVMSHWDSRSLFRYMATGTHSALSGLIAMLVAVDILSAGRGEGYSRDLVFLSLSGEAYDLIGSRQLLFNLDSDIGKHGESVAGLHKGSIAALIEVGMLGHDPGVGNDTAADAPVSPRDDVRREVFLHQVGDDRLRVNEAFQSAVRFERAPTVLNSTGDSLPPSSLLAWNRVLPDVGATYLGDFDRPFNEDSFWSYKDLGLRDWSRNSVAHSAILLARALHVLASGKKLDVTNISMQAASDLTDELFECLAKPHGLRCHLVQSMTGTHLFSSAERNTAEQYVGVLRELPADDQSRGPTHKKNIERFVWEFLANRTYSGDPHDVPNSDGEMVGCDNNVNTCPDNEICLHVSGAGGDQGQCVRADVRYTPAYPTNLKFHPCDKSKDPDCVGVWGTADVSDVDASAWAKAHGLPEDPMWTETFNEDVGVTVNLRERPLHDAILLACGLMSTGLATGVVVGIKALHKRQKLD